MKCKKCNLNEIWMAHSKVGKYCLSCGIETRKPKKGELQGVNKTREKVRIRDNHTCQDCGKKWEKDKRRFDCHHLNGLCGKKSRKYDRVSDMGGLITLCHKCHFNRPEHRVKRKKLLTS